MTLAMVKQGRRLIIAHAKQRHGPVDIRIVTANDMACGNVDKVFTLIRKDAFHVSVDETQRGPPRKEDGMLVPGLATGERRN